MSESIGAFLEEAGALTRAENGVWLVLASVDSTSSAARRIARRAERHLGATPVAVIAWHQTAGRGRDGRRWESRPGEGVLASVLVQLRDPRALGLLPLSVGVALADGMSNLVGGGVRLRWPNDLYLGGAKLGGILVESITRGSSSWAVIGFGVNYGDQLPSLEGRTVTSLRLHQRDLPSLAGVAVRSVRAVLEVLREPLTSVDLIKRAEELSSHQIGAEIRLRSSTREVSGTYLGLDSHGFLRLETRDGVQSVAVGEVLHT